MEINERKCKTCGVMKKRILVGKYDHKNKKYVDEHDKSWMGNKCPECHVAQVRLNMQLLRVKRKV